MLFRWPTRQCFSTAPLPNFTFSNQLNICRNLEHFLEALTPVINVQERKSGYFMLPFLENEKYYRNYENYDNPSGSDRAS
jgi:hypothetical protein